MKLKSKSFHLRYAKNTLEDIDLDEIFLDSKNLPSFDKDQFEGRIEKSISPRAIFSVFGVFIFINIIFLIKVVDLQIVHGADFFKKSENNRLDQIPLFALRGVIYDRNNIPLAWNSIERQSSEIPTPTAEQSDVSSPQPLNSSTQQATNSSILISEPKSLTSNSKLLTSPLFPHRSYITTHGFGHILGYVSYPKQDRNRNYYQKEFIGKAGIEEYYNKLLSGENGLQIIETDVYGKAQSGTIIEKPHDGALVTLSVDSRIQEKLHAVIRDIATTAHYRAGAGGFMDIETGEILALTSYPEYNSGVLSEAQDTKQIQEYQRDKGSVFLDRAVSGLYTPGSTIKPIMAIAALNEKMIAPEKKILSTGSISITNPYNKDVTTIFRDWKAHGWTDMRRAIAVSSDVYFYAVGGGYKEQKGIGIRNIEKYSKMFGFGSLTGIDLAREKPGTIPSPEWKAKIFSGEPWRLGNTYHTIIGQYGFQVTLLQELRAIASIANNGKLVTPHLLKKPVYNFPQTTISIPADYFTIAREGMRAAVTEGTMQLLSFKYVTVAGKTGTAELDSKKKYINSWVVGFFPYEKPRYVFAVVMEQGPYSGTVGSVSVMRQMFDWMNQNTPDYLKVEL